MYFFQKNSGCLEKVKMQEGLYLYYFRTLSGKVFISAAPSLSTLRFRRDKWIDDMADEEHEKTSIEHFEELTRGFQDAIGVPS